MVKGGFEQQEMTKKGISGETNFKAIQAIFDQSAIFSSKLTPEHISKMAGYQHDENMTQLKIDEKRPYFVIAGLSLFLLFFVIMIFFLKENESLLRDIFDKMVYVIVGIFGGIGIDKTFLSKKTKSG